jgi:PiT family inorganic phosphate transporter
VVYYGILTPIQAALIGTTLLWIGAFLLSERVIETVGKGITSLDAFSGFSAQFSAGISVLIFTTLGMPVSTTYCIIGGIVGVGVLKGIRTIKINLLKKILLSWVLTPLTTFAICYILAKVLARFVW